ncbi:MAG: YihA family ribosome biogenesis GTP-binding protein [Clostridiales bacterium]|nr:YihA family ribosome biogenesis GTP-binding protein [Clostridiales bacterium]
MTIHFRNTKFVKSAADIGSLPDPDRPEVVISGKSNVGKSSLINALADNRKLSRVSGEPGKTRLVVYFDVDDKLYLVDLPGYGYAKAPHTVQAQYSSLVENYFGVGRPISLVLHLIDVRHDPTDRDLLMISYMQSNRIPFFIVFNKTDKLSYSAVRQKTADHLLKIKPDADVRVFSVSSQKKSGVEDLRNAIQEHLSL